MTQTIVAFDIAELEKATALLDEFPEPIYIKIGMENFYSLGNEFIKQAKARGHRIFLDLKLHDIPNTVSHAMAQLAKLQVDMINVHASGGIDMMKAAVQAVKANNPACLCIAVTMLTSLNDADAKETLGLSKSIFATTLHYAKNAQRAGMDGVVCSVHEVAAIHEQCGHDFVCVTPGIQYGAAVALDQKRIATPSQARDAGANYIVVGRSITQSAKPYETYQLIEKELHA